MGIAGAAIAPRDIRRHCRGGRRPIAAHCCTLLNPAHCLKMFGASSTNGSSEMATALVSWIVNLMFTG